MDIDHITNTSGTDTTAYGGCRHRLKYDPSINNHVEKAIRPFRMIAIFAIVLLFLVLGLIILHYYKNRVHDIIGDENADAHNNAVNFIGYSEQYPENPK